MRKQSDETGTTSTTVGASFMNWRGDVALGGNAQTQFNVGKDTQLTARANLNRSARSLLAFHARRSRSANLIAAVAPDNSRCVRAPTSGCSLRPWASCPSCAPSLAACARAMSERTAFSLPCNDACGRRNQEYLRSAGGRLACAWCGAGKEVGSDNSIVPQCGASKQRAVLKSCCLAVRRCRLPLAARRVRTATPQRPMPTFGACALQPSCAFTAQQHLHAPHATLLAAPSPASVTRSSLVDRSGGGTRQSVVRCRAAPARRQRGLLSSICCSAAPTRISDSVEDWAEVFDEAEEASAASAESGSVGHDTIRVRNRAYLVGVSFKQRPRATAAAPTLSIEDSLDELAQLADTAGLEVCGRIFQNLSAPDNRTYVGTGKLEELLEQARSLDVDTLIFDDELRPSQARNVERVANAAGGSVRIVDRVELILDIFRQRAATREGFLQTQLARVNYQLPRLTKLWQHLERQTGGGGLATKGMGESQLEVDKRLLRLQATRIKEKLERVRTHRALHRMRRASAPLPVVALCGYTSAGKSTLLNLLTNADAYTDPQLFATLDPTTRRAIVPGSGQALLVTDTVGFIQKLPTQLVAAFRATLEEIGEASLILHVVDASKADIKPHMAAVEAVLSQIDGVEHVRPCSLSKLARSVLMK